MCREVSYGKSGMGSGGTCPRCHKGVHQHAVSGCEIDKATSDAVGRLIAASKSIANARMRDREFMRQARVGGKTQQDANETADRMVGALIAKTENGRDYKFTAISGPHGSSVSLSDFDTADPVIPQNQQGWIDIYGRNFVMPSLGSGITVNQPCAAIKLLLKLGSENKSGKKFKYIHLYEEACRGDSDIGKKSKKLAQWRGQGTNYVYAAHSCKHCRARVPAILCDGADD